MFAIIRNVARLVFALLGAAVAKRTGAKSDRAIAEDLGISEPTVRRARDARAKSGAEYSAPERVTGADGKSYPAKRPIYANDDDKDEEGVPANEKPDDDTEPRGLELERLPERNSAPRIEHEADETVAHTNYLDEKRKKEIKRSQEMHRRLSIEQEPQPKKRTFMDTLREQLKDVKPLPRDLSRDRDRGMER